VLAVRCVPETNRSPPIDGYNHLKLNSHPIAGYPKKILG